MMYDDLLQPTISAARGVPKVTKPRDTRMENSFEKLCLRFVLVLCCMHFLGVAFVTHSWLLLGMTVVATGYVGYMAHIGINFRVHWD